MADFERIKIIGRGSFGKVILAEKKSDIGQAKELYAIQILDQQSLSQRNQLLSTLRQKSILKSIKHPFIVKLYYAFQSSTSLYLVLDFLNGGELFFHLQSMGRFSEARTKFYVAEIVLALQYLHSKGIVYRDLKPENIILDIDGHIVLTDFGLSKEGIFEEGKTNTLCGTPEYLAPELISNKGHGKNVDWWSLGILTYELLTGTVPYQTKDMNQLYQNIQEKPIYIPRYLSDECRSFLTALLKIDSEERLGSKDEEDIQKHEFFKDIDWDLLVQKQIEPPFKTQLNGKRDLRYFDVMHLQDSFQNSMDSNVNSIIQNQFQNFTFLYNQSVTNQESILTNQTRNISIVSDLKTSMKAEDEKQIVSKEGHEYQSVILDDQNDLIENIDQDKFQLIEENPNFQLK